MIEKFLHHIDKGPVTIATTHVFTGPNLFVDRPAIVVRLEGKVPSEKHETLQHLFEMGSDLTKRPASSLVHTLASSLIEAAGMVHDPIVLPPDDQHVIIPYLEKDAVSNALKLAIAMINHALSEPSRPWQEWSDTLSRESATHLLDPMTRAIIRAAATRNIIYHYSAESGALQLGTGTHQRRLPVPLRPESPSYTAAGPDERYPVHLTLLSDNLPVPPMEKVDDSNKAADLLEKWSSVAIKPLRGSDKGPWCSIKERDALLALPIFNEDEEVLVQSMVAGRSHRLLVISFRLVGAITRHPAEVVGDGHQDLASLIERANAAPHRGPGFSAPRSWIQPRALTPSDKATILPAGTAKEVGRSARLCDGAGSIDVLKQVHPYYREIAEKTATSLGLDIVEIDLVTTDIGNPCAPHGIVDICSRPDFRGWLCPEQGEPADIGNNFLSLLFAGQEKTRIPCISVMGGPITATFIHHLFDCLNNTAFGMVGRSSKDGIYIGDMCFMDRDMTETAFSWWPLQDPRVDCALLQLSPQQLSAQGLPFCPMDLSIVLDGTTEDLPLLKLALKNLTVDGWPILNADIPVAETLITWLEHRLILCTTRSDHPSILPTLNGGGVVVGIINDRIVLRKGRKTNELFLLKDLPESGRPLELNEILVLCGGLYALNYPLRMIHGLLHAKIFNNSKS